MKNKKKILYYLLIFVMITKISLYYELSINKHKSYTLSNSINVSYDEGQQITAVKTDSKLQYSIVEYVSYSLLIIFFICLTKSSNININVLNIDRRKQMYWIMISKMHGSIYKNKALIP